MKVYINNYRHHWISPYHILEFVCFWEKDNDVFYNHEDKPDAPYEKWVNRLDPICKAIHKFLDFVHPKIDYVKIDYWDTWSMDHTLGMMALPMLKQLQTKKQGAPFVDDEDVPEELKSTSAPPKENEWDTDENHFKRWDWVMAEMIFAFEHHVNNEWEEKYHKGKRTKEVYKFDGLKERFECILNCKIRNWWNHDVNGCFQSCIGGEQLVYHCDAQEYAGIIFLTPDAPPQSGTSFYRSRHTKKMKFNLYDENEFNVVFKNGFLDSTEFELVDVVGNVYNRLVLFDAKMIHAASNYFGNNLNNGRLFQIFFFDLDIYTSEDL
jgi:hypothetical protein